MIHPQRLLYSYSCSTATNDKPHPGILHFLDTRPESVLLTSVLLELLFLSRIVSRVALFLAGFGFLVAAEVAQEDVVGDGPEEL